MLLKYTAKSIFRNLNIEFLKNENLNMITVDELPRVIKYAKNYRKTKE